MMMSRSRIKFQVSQRPSILIIILAIGLLLLSALLLLQDYEVKRQSDNDFRISFIDVGQGDATLVQSGNREVLIDGGRNRDVLFGLGALLPFWDRQLDYVIATHPDADHIGGLVSVFDRYQVDRVIDNAEVINNQVYDGYVTSIL